MKRLIYVLSLIFIANLNCGVKGPPEPPLPTEASLQKQILKENEKAATPKAEGTPAPVQEKKAITPKKKTKTQ